MQLVWRVTLVALTAFLFAAPAPAQASAPAHKPVSWKQYCQADNGFCFKYPGWWKMLGEIFDGNGVVIAPAQKEDEKLWDEITVAMVAPPPEGDNPGLALNGVIEQAAAGMRDAGQNFQTLRRQERTVDAKPAQLLKAQYRDKTNGKDWIEELVFIQGPDNEIYSVALKAAPQDVAHLEPIFSEVLRTWKLPEAKPPTEDPAGTQQSAPAAKPPAEAQPQHD